MLNKHGEALLNKKHMKTFTVKAEAISGGPHGKSFRKGETITEGQIIPAHLKELLDQKAIEESVAQKEVATIPYKKLDAE